MGAEVEARVGRALYGVGRPGTAATHSRMDRAGPAGHIQIVFSPNPGFIASARECGGRDCVLLRRLASFPLTLPS